ncbi:hypothetical protein [Methylobacterium mesophilicum]
MASDPDDPSDAPAGELPQSPPRDRILTQVTPREGWTGDWGAAIDELCACVSDRYCDAHLQELRWRLAPLLTKSAELVAVGKVDGKKPATFIRNKIVELRDTPPDEAVEALRHPHPVLRNYLDVRLEAEDAAVDRPSAPALAADERAARRHALATAPDSDVLPQPRRGTENPWAVVAGLVAELLYDVTGDEPKRSYDAYAEADSGWPLTFFQRFAALAVPSANPPCLNKVWRDALEARAEK